MIYALIELGKLEILQKSPEKAVLYLDSAAAILDSNAKSGKVSNRDFEQWLKDRRGVAFWTAEALRNEGKSSENRDEKQYVNRLSQAASELRTQRMRATAIPPDMVAQQRLQALMAKGAKAFVK